MDIVNTLVYKEVYYLKFEWDENKNIANIQKHNVSFEEAMTVFKDSKAVIIYDDSEFEDRFNIIGLSQMSNLLIVCHCYRERDTVIRIISARKPTKIESKYYKHSYKG
jgi:uncharacterized DUF497 family protein